MRIHPTVESKKIQGDIHRSWNSKKFKIWAWITQILGQSPPRSSPSAPCLDFNIPKALAEVLGMFFFSIPYPDEVPPRFPWEKLAPRVSLGKLSTLQGCSSPVAAETQPSCISKGEKKLEKWIFEEEKELEKWIFQGGQKEVK